MKSIKFAPEVKKSLINLCRIIPSLSISIGLKSSNQTLLTPISNIEKREITFRK